MLDIKFVRANPEKAKAAMAERSGGYLPVLETILGKDAAYRAALAEIEELRSRRNEVSKKIQVAKALLKRGPEAPGLFPSEHIPTRMGTA